MATIKLVQHATYFAGFSRPFFIPQSMIRSHLEELGATNIQFHDRDEPLPIHPSTDPAATDKWDEWVSAEYHGAPKTITEKKRWAWAVRQEPSSNPSPSPQAPKVNSPQVARAVEAEVPWGLIAAGAAGVFLILRARR